MPYLRLLGINLLIVSLFFDYKAFASIRKYLLPSSYDLIIPPKPRGAPIDVEVEITDLRLITVNEGELSITIDLFIKLKWTEPRLNITNATLTAITDQLILDKTWDKKLWCPSVFFKNGIRGDMYLEKSPMSYFEIFPNKSVQMTQRVSVVLFCHMSFRKYPHDKHSCAINIGMMSHRIKTVRLKWSKTELSPDLYNTDYMVSLNQSDSVDCTDYDNPRAFACLQTALVLDRGLGYFVSRKYVPSFIIVSTSFIGFWIPSHSYPARVTLIVTSLLSLITQQVQTVHIYASYIISIHIWNNICTTFVFLGLIEFVIATCWDNNNINQTKKNKSCEDERRHDFHRPSCFFEKLFRGMKHFGSGTNQVDAYSKIIFPIAFVLVAIAYYTWVDSMEDFDSRVHKTPR
ncbi:glutamate-gated chloride channel subunit beta-like [Tetranychus urticae]|nr:glutamate-gated chloride channel subunit beta-like [Tetranychus urticae]XP_015789125.1 glutamate-gated chloride channel subunit beta-like [Tetranychus urticae]